MHHSFCEMSIVLAIISRSHPKNIRCNTQTSTTSLMSKYAREPDCPQRVQQRRGTRCGHPKESQTPRQGVGAPGQYVCGQEPDEHQYLVDVEARSANKALAVRDEFGHEPDVDRHPGQHRGDTEGRDGKTQRPTAIQRV